jgi:hypothetical protein
MYSLTLSLSERQAIDFVGFRYAHGDDLYDVLSEADWEDDEEWGIGGDITFTMKEHQAWQINEIAEESEYLFDLFSNELCNKMMKFCEQIV